MKILKTLLYSLLSAGLLVGCAQSSDVAIEGDASAKPQTSSIAKIDESLPPLEDFSVRDTIIHSMHQKSYRLDLQTLRYYNRKVKRSDLLVLQERESSHITNLVIADLQLDDADIEPISKMKLWKLDLAYNPVRDLHALRNMKSLAELNLDYSNVNRAGLQVVASLTNLTKLFASGTTISDADLPLLYSMKRLKTLGLNECKNVSPDGVARFRQALPSCMVETGLRSKGFHEIGRSDLRTVEQGLMRQREYAEADLALQKFISNWSKQNNPPYALLAEAYRLRGECQKALGNSSAAEEMSVESSKFHSRSKDLKNHPE